MQWKLLKRSEINVEKWNNCVIHSHQYNVYGLVWFLDAVTENKWEAYVLEDYIAVFPVEIKSKLYIKYITQPFLCQQLGLFNSMDEVLQSIIGKLLKKIKKSVWKFDMLVGDRLENDLKCYVKTNHILSLENSYDFIFSKFNRNTKRNIKEASLATLHLDTKANIEDITSFFKCHDPTGLIEKNTNKVQALCNASLQLNKGQLWIASESDKIRAASFFIIEGNKVYFLLCTSDERGKQIKAMYFLINEIIKKYAGSNLILDFTGSSINNIARRNVGFGASSESYYHIKFKRV